MNDWSDYVRQAERDFILLGKARILELLATYRMDADVKKELEYQQFREAVNSSEYRLDDEGMLVRRDREREERREIAEEANDDRLIDEMKEARHAYR